jgi:hypothetical protein
MPNHVWLQNKRLLNFDFPSLTSVKSYDFQKKNMELADLNGIGQVGLMTIHKTRPGGAPRFFIPREVLSAPTEKIIEVWPHPMTTL